MKERIYCKTNEERDMVLEVLEAKGLEVAE